MVIYMYTKLAGIYKSYLFKYKTKTKAFICRPSNVMFLVLSSLLPQTCSSGEVEILNISQCLSLWHLRGIHFIYPSAFWDRP